MKRFIAVVATISSFSACADWTLKNERELNDLMYLPTANTFYGTTSIDFKNHESDLNYNTQLFSKIEVDSTEIVQSFGYAISDNLSLGIRVAQLLSQKDKYTYGPASTIPNTVTKNEKKGFEDPSVNLKYRFLNQEESSFNGDFKLAVSPSLGDQKESSATVKGNAYRGGSLIAAGGEFGKKYTDMGWKLGADVGVYGKQKSKDATDPSEITEVDSRTNVDVNFSWQWTVNPTFTINLNTSLGLIAEESSINTVGDMKSIAESGNSFLIGTDLIFHLSKKMSINLGLNGKSHSERTVTLTEISTNSSLSFTSKDATEGMFNVAAKYEF